MPSEEETGLAAREREGDQEEQTEEYELDGPDPRTWPHDPRLGGLLADIEILHRAVAAMRGSSGARSGAAYDLVMNLLATLHDEARGQFAAALAEAYGMIIPEDGAVVTFETAGKPRAYGGHDDHRERTD